MKLERDRVTKQLRDLESRMSILKNNLKVLDVKMEKMVEANDKKKHCLSTQHFHFAGVLSN
jgi:stress response protein YsnF